ncbi:MAG: mammalian cell entry protein [Betaproteobacteria bacterium]|nr:mammalian cell entry protein [Betaproteobacteria bacterium]
MSASPSPPPSPDTAPVAAPAHVELKASILLLTLALLIGGAALYLSYARGAFESTQRLVLIAEDAEGVSVGMSMTFAGFPIGRVRRIELGSDGNARILVDVPLKDAHWLRTSSVFTLSHGVVGSTNIRAFSGILNDPPLPDGAERMVLGGDASAEIPRLMNEAHQLLQNLNAMTADGSSINESLANVKTFTEKLNGRGGAMGALLGGDAEAAKLRTTLDRTNTLLARLDGLAAKADTQVFGADGMMRDAQSTVQQLNAMLVEARASLKRVDALLDDAKVVGANARVASTDLGVLRAEVDASLRHVDYLINELNRKWPFARDSELKLP